MISPTKWKCELGGETYESRDSVRDDIQILNGEESRHYNEVCVKHIAELNKIIDANFPKNRYAREKSVE